VRIENHPTTIGTRGSATMSIGSVGSTASSPASEVSDLGQTPAEQARIDQAMTFFMDQGWSRAQAAGIVGNLWAESRVKHDQAQHGGGPGYGLAQWEGPRQASFAQWAGHDIRDSTMQEQLEFIQWELTNTERGAGNALREATTADQAARIVMTRYERPADQSEGAQRGRAAVAGDIYASATGTPGSAPAPESPAPSPAPEPSAGDSVSVRRGDTLSGIATRNGVSLDALLAANPQIRNPDLIYPGQTVHLPGGSAGGEVTVRSGDTLSGIAARNGVPLDALLAANPQIRNPDLIHPGQQVQLPGGTSAAAEVTVRGGDTLSGIAQAHGVSLGALLGANPQIRNPDLIHPGQVVRIPGAAGGAQPQPPTEAPPPSGDVPTYAPYTVYSTGHAPPVAVSHPDQMQPHHDYQTRVRDGQTLEVRDIVLHRDGQSQTQQAIPAPVAGTVVSAGPLGSAGNAVVLRGDQGQLVYIFHMSSIDVRAGQRVDYGQDLGNQGSTGNSTGPHIHIEAPSATIDRWVNDLLDGRFDGRQG
jgi:LysM repeat protein